MKCLTPVRRRLLIGAALAFFAAAFGSAPHAQAALNNMPNPTDFTSNVRLLVGNPSTTGTGIDAPYSIVKIYSTTPTISVGISNFGECYTNPDNYNYDWYPHGDPSPGATLYEIFATDAAENSIGAALPGGSASNSGTCTSDRSLTVTHSGGKSAKLGHTNYYVFIFKATMVGTGFGWNGFQVNAPAGAYVGYSDKSGDEFAIKPQFHEKNGPTYSTFNFRFAPSCETSAAISKNLKWFDADQGQGNQVSTIQFDLIDLTTNTTIYNNYTNVGGQNARRTLAVTFQPGHNYLWRWENVSSYNGLQLELPFDSIYYNLPCEAGDVQPSSAVDKPKLTTNEVATFTHYGNVTNFTFGDTLNYSVQRYRNGVATGSAQAGTFTTSANGQFALRTNTYTALAADVGVTICERLTLSGGSSTISNNPSESCTSVTSRPYMVVDGNDIWAGSRFDYAGDQCVSQSARSSDISSWTLGSTGASGSYGLFALGAITGFGSAGQPGGNGLTFANTPSSGGLAAPTKCMPDTYATIGTGGAAWPGYAGLSANMGRRTYFVNGNLTLGAGTIPTGTQVALIVNGTITITGNIGYGDVYASDSAISSLWLIAKGNINIQENVSSIYGYLVAQGTSLAPGKIQTCVRTGQATTYTPLTNAVCNTGLTIYGALRADTIYWQRTRGTVGSGGTFAESVVFDPGLYLNSPLTPTYGSANIQDARDLPPVY